MNIVGNNRSVKESAQQFIENHESYQNPKPVAALLYKKLQEDKRLSIKTRNSLMMKVRNIYKQY